MIAIAGSLGVRFIVEMVASGGTRADPIEVVARARGDLLDFPAASPCVRDGVATVRDYEISEDAAADPLECYDGRSEPWSPLSSTNLATARHIAA